MDFRIKRDSYGFISQYKARLVAEGFHQTADIDCDEIYSPVVKPITIRVLLTLALTYVFLHG